MEKFGIELYDDSGTGDQKQTNPPESLRLSIQRCIKYLSHASQCSDVNCRLPSCQKMKRVLQHFKSCKQKTNGCSVCKQLVALSCYHAKYCQEAICPVPCCASIKNKFRLSKPESRLQEAVMLKRCIAAMENLRLSGENSSCGNAGKGMKSSSGPSVGALQAVQQVQATAARQRLISSNQQMQTQLQKPMSWMMSGVPNHMLNMGNVASWKNSRYAQNPQIHQNTQHLSNPQLGQQHPAQIMGGPNSMSNSFENSTTEPLQVMPNSGPSIAGMQWPTQAWQQLLEVLRSPASAQQQQKVLSILKANPSLMAAFIRQRAAAQLQEQQQQLQQMFSNKVNYQAPQCSQQNLYHFPTEQSAQNSQSQAVSLLQNSSNAAIANQTTQSFLPADNLKSKVKTENVLTNAPPTAPETLPIVKDWRQSVTQDLRHHLVQKIIQVILPTTDTKTYQDLITFQDSRMFNLVAYAEEVERGIYSAANSWEEYYQLLAEKIPKIRTEFEKKLDEKADVANATAASWYPDTANMIGNNAAASTPIGTSGLSGPDQMTNNNDMMLSHLTNPVSSDPSTTNQLQYPVSQELGLSLRDNMDLTQEESTWQTC